MNNVIWFSIHKKTFIQIIEILSYGIYDATACFNNYFIKILEILVKLVVDPGKYITTTMKRVGRTWMIKVNPQTTVAIIIIINLKYREKKIILA